LFWHFYFNNKISYGFLIQEGIIKGPPQSITEIGHGSYLTIKDRGILIMVLLSIKPKFVNQIIKGNKKFEF